MPRWRRRRGVGRPRSPAERGLPVGSGAHEASGCPLPSHVTPGPTGHRGRWRHERLRPGALLGPGPSRRGLRRLHPGVGGRPPDRGRHRAGVPGPPHLGRASPPHGQGGPARRGRGVRRRRPEGHAGIRGPGHGVGRALRRRARQLLAERRGRTSHQAPAQPAPGVHLPHPRPGQGRGQSRRGRGRRPPPPGRGRGRHHPVLGHRAGQLLGGGGPDLRALRRRSVPHPDRGPGRRSRVLRPR